MNVRLVIEKFLYDVLYTAERKKMRYKKYLFLETRINQRNDKVAAWEMRKVIIRKEEEGRIWMNVKDENPGVNIENELKQEMDTKPS